MMKVKSRYLAIRGSTREVGGCKHHNQHHHHYDHHPIIIMIIIILIMIITKIFETSSRNTTRERRMEMPKVTFSPACIMIMIRIMNVTTKVVLILIITVANILNKYDNLENWT